MIDIEKFPQGLKALVDDVNRVGCKFGIWWEPEMVSEQSVSYLFMVNSSQINFDHCIVGSLHCSSRLVFPCSRQTSATRKKSNGSGSLKTRCARLFVQLHFNTIKKA